MGANKNIRQIITAQTVVFGTPFVFTATDEDDDRLRTQNCGLFYILKENSGGTGMTFRLRNKVINAAKEFNASAVTHTGADGTTIAASFGFGLSDDGDYLQNNGARGTRIAAGYEIELTKLISGQADVTVEAHYGRESGG